VVCRGDALGLSAIVLNGSGGHHRHDDEGNDKPSKQFLLNCRVKIEGSGLVSHEDNSTYLLYRLNRDLVETNMVAGKWALV
jgi:hypothetical protein